MRTDRGRKPVFFTAVILVAGLFACATSAVAQPDVEGTSAELEAVIDSVRDAHSEATETLEKLADERLDAEPVLEAADYDLDSIVAWVAENTRWVPYPGVLRGVNGVLLDQSGNSLDRSLLLASLLADAGYEARLVHGRLSPRAIDAALARASSTAQALPPDPPPLPDGVITAAGQAPEQAKNLAGLVGTLPDGTSQAGKELVDHWWVEAQSANEWVTLDPLLTGPLEDMRPKPLETLSPDSVPESLYQKVTVRVVIEKWNAGEITEAIPLEHSLRAADAVYHDLEFLFVPYHFDPPPEDADAAQQAQAVAETSEEWLPVLRFGKETIREQGFDQDGNLERDPGRIAAARKAEAATSALQALGSKKDESSDTHLSALWLEYQVDVPGREPRIERRELFDLIGPARRRSGSFEGLDVDVSAITERGRSLMGMHRILVTSATPPSVALKKAAWEFWAEHGPQIAALIRLVYNPEDDESAARATRQPLSALDLLGLATARHALSPHRSSIYLASPNILSTHFIAKLGDPYQVRKAFDIVINDVGVVPAKSGSASRIRLEQGVLDTILEAAMLGTGPRSGNTADLFAGHGGVSGNWQRVDQSTQLSALSETARARIENALEAGQIVVAPQQIGPGQEPAWWEIEPATGTTLGIGHNGWGVVAEQTVRGIGTGALTHGARRYAMSTYCVAAVSFLTAGGWIFTGLGGTVVYTWQAVEFLIARGCSIVI